MKREKTTEKRKPLAVVVEPVVLHPTRTFETRCFWCGRANRVTQYEYGKAEGLKIGQETRNYCPACKKNTRHYVGVFMQNPSIDARQAEQHTKESR